MPFATIHPGYQNSQRFGDLASGYDNSNGKNSIDYLDSTR